MSSLGAALLACQVALAPATADSVRRNLEAIAAELPSPDNVRRTLDSLRTESAAIARGRPRSFALTDTIVAGPFTLHATRTERDAFGAALPDVAAAWAQLFTGEVPPVLLEVRGGGWISDRTLVARFATDTVDPATTYLGTRLRLGHAAVSARRTTDQVLGQLLWQRADSSLRRWLPVPPPVVERGTDADALAYQWTTAAGPASRACRAGDATRCPAAFGLEPTDAKELSVAIRAALLAHALEVGGPGAWSRLIADPSRPLTERLAAAGDRDLDALVRGWVAELRAARQEAAWEDPIRWLAGLTWIAVALGSVVGVGVRR